MEDPPPWLAHSPCMQNSASSTKFGLLLWERMWSSSMTMLSTHTQKQQKQSLHQVLQELLYTECCAIRMEKSPALLRQHCVVVTCRKSNQVKQKPSRQLQTASQTRDIQPCFVLVKNRRLLYRMALQHKCFRCS